MAPQLGEAGKDQCEPIGGRSGLRWRCRTSGGELLRRVASGYHDPRRRRREWSHRAAAGGGAGPAHWWCRALGAWRCGAGSPPRHLAVGHRPDGGGLRHLVAGARGEHHVGLVGQADLAVGNVVGSNIFNVLFILGLSALITPLVVARQLVRLDVPIMLAASLVLPVLAWNGSIGRLEGLLLAGGEWASIASPGAARPRERTASRVTERPA